VALLAELLVGQPGQSLIVALVLLLVWSLLCWSGAVSGRSARPLLRASLAWGLYAACEALVPLRTPDAKHPGGSAADLAAAGRAHAVRFDQGNDRGKTVSKGSNRHGLALKRRADSKS
jgi:hypothetical protein